MDIKTALLQSKELDRLIYLDPPKEANDIFGIKSEEVAEFQYIGLNIKKNRDNVKLGQKEYKKLKCIQVEGGWNLKDRISAIDVTKTRQLIGQLNWLATQTRPDLSYDISELSSMLK